VLLIDELQCLAKKGLAALIKAQRHLHSLGRPATQSLAQNGRFCLAVFVWLFLFVSTEP